ncbi:MAG: hypothetical protein ACRENG_32630 [bacterium]
MLAYGHEVAIEIVPSFQYKMEILFSEYPLPRNLLGHLGFLTKWRLHGGANWG